jgi:predicted ATPase
MNYRINSVKIEGYRPFKEFRADFGPLEVIVGANGSGKSSLFEFLKFLRDSLYQDIPPEIISGSIGQQIFHVPGPDRFQWDLEIETGFQTPISYQGQLIGPIGRTHISYERVQSLHPLDKRYTNPFIYMDVQLQRGVINNQGKLEKSQDIALKRPNQLALRRLARIYPRLEILELFQY